MKRRQFLNQLATAGATASATAGALKGAASVAQPTSGQGHKGPMRLAAVGDCLIARKVSQLKDPAFLELVELLRGTDCTWGNGEMLFLDAAHHHPGRKGADPHASCPPWGADELAWMGIDFVGLANNHIMDFLTSGMMANMEHLNRVGIAFAGAGANLDQAARPSYVDTPSGRVGQVSFCSTHPDWFAASYANARVPGRPGLNPLSITYLAQVDTELFARMAQLRGTVLEKMGLQLFMELIDQGAPEDRLSMGTLNFLKGETDDLVEEPSEADMERIEAALTAARTESDVVLATMHSHESRNSQEEPAGFMQPVARRAIDAGADAFINTGPHRLRGIELYQGKPIFYSLADFFFQYESIRNIPAEALMVYGMDRNSLDVSPYYAKIPYPNHEAYWQSVVAMMTWDAGQLTNLELHPIVQGFGLPRHQRGTPMRAKGAAAKAIIDNLARLSKPYGTEIRFQDDIGRVVLG